MDRLRVVVTGMGCLSPLGNDRVSTWDGLRTGRSGVARITAFDPSDFPSQIAGEVKGFDPVELLGRKEARRTSRPVALAVAAAREAVSDSRIDLSAVAEETAVIIASGVGGLAVAEQAVLANARGGYRRISVYAAAGMLVDMPAGMVAADVGARGPNFAVVSACASGAHSIGEAAEQIRRGDAVVALAGGVEAAITPVGVGLYCAIGALSRRNADPEAASRPFDIDRDGFVSGEGAAVLVLEELGHALARGARIYAELVGYGATADAGHITQPDPTASQAARCVRLALRKAGREPAEVGYVNAHGTSTPLNDAAETKALRAALGDAVHAVPVSSTKSMTGHLSGAAGAIEAMIAVLAISDGFLPPTINLDRPDPACNLHHLAHTGRPATPSLTISTSFGFGGHNACLAFARVDTPQLGTAVD